MAAGNRHGATSAFALIVGAAMVLTGSEAAAGEDPASEALHYDMKKLVAAQEDAGWTIDAYELDDLLPDALMSVCRTNERARQAALADAQRDVARHGGPLKEAFEAAGNLDDLGDLVTATRVYDLLSMAIGRAAADCMPWLVVEPDFRGLQTDAHRITLNLEAGGLFVAQTSGGRDDIGGGGSGRLLLLYGLDHNYSVLLGGEFGGAALFQRDEETTQFPLLFQFAVPLVLRHRLLTFHHDLELAPLFNFTEEDTGTSYGVRVGGLLALSTFRIRNIMPWAGMGLAFEYLFETDQRPQSVAMKGGARVGFDWDF